MKAIRYGLHFVMLTVAAVIFSLVQDLRLTSWLAGFDYFHYAVMGTLHSASILISLREPKAVQNALGFVTLATTLSAVTPWLGLLGSVVWSPFSDIVRENGLGPDTIFVTASAIGAAGYWLLVRRFLLTSLRRVDLLRTVALCATATALVGLTLHKFDGYDRGVAKINPAIVSPMLTLAWWFAFSISLYWAEMSAESRRSSRAVEGNS